jgi:DNA-binding MarR family transcriptional regulator
MMQETKTISAPPVSSRGTVSGRRFAVLFALAGSDSTDARVLESRLGLSRDELLRIIDDLQRKYLVDVVSTLEGPSVHETLRLTEEGEELLLRSLEQMCELPETSRP